LLSKKARSPPGGSKTIHGATADSSGKSSNSQQSPETTQQHNLPDHDEVERLRAAAATEITTEEVKPIQTDFHFFVKEHIDTHRKLAEEQVRSSIEDKSGKLDPVLVNTDLNTRLMKTWEGLTKENRDAYMVQEEADRRRFMEDDEIASRHCATLTARGKSPRAVGGDGNKDLAQHQKPQQPEDAPEEKKIEVSIKEAKRSAPEPAGEPDVTSDLQESPTKKNKVGQ